MKKSYAAGLAVILVALLGCTLTDPLSDPELVSSLRFSPSAFDSFTKNTELRYTLKSPAVVSISIQKKDTLGLRFIVKRLTKNTNETKGTHSVTWLGDTDQRYFAPVGIYYGVVVIGDRFFETSVQVFHF